MVGESRDQIYTNLKIARGQIDGILKMLDERRYCIDISRQFMATLAILRKANALLLHDHMKSCVKTAIQEGHGDESLEEIFEIIDKYMR